MERRVRWVMMSMMVVVPMMILSITVASAETKYFQYIFTNKYGDVVFTDELLPSTIGNKKHFKVEFDNMGRIMNYATLVNWRAISTNELNYSGDSKFYTEFVFYDATGVKKNITRIMRTPSGERIRREFFTVSGEMTSYTTYNYFPDRYEWVNFTADNKLTGKYRTYFDNRDIVYKEIRFPINEDAYYIGLFDTKTGFITAQDKYEKGKHIVHTKYSYNENNMLIKRDLYNPLNNNNWYGANDYNDDLLIGKRYIFKDGATQEIKTEYGKDRVSTQSWLYRNNKLVCRFVYERRANGSIIRTLAYNGSGDLMAEYLNKVVDHINGDGSPLDGGEYKIYKKPVW
jgi:hypothetical protein